MTMALCSSCKHYSNVFLAAKIDRTSPTYTHAPFAISTLEINADMVDDRDRDDTKMKAPVTTLIEMLMP